MKNHNIQYDINKQVAKNQYCHQVKMINMNILWGTKFLYLPLGKLQKNKQKRLKAKEKKAIKSRVEKQLLDTY